MNMDAAKWIGMDLTGTLMKDKGAGKSAQFQMTEPIPKMIEVTKSLLKRGYIVKIFTAHANDPKNIPLIQDWCKKYIGQVLSVTNVKQLGMLALFDDRAIRVKRNTGQPFESLDEIMKDL